MQARIEFQTLMVQLFLQRRFEHVLMATRFYRHLFSDGGTTLKVGKETEEVFAKGTGMPPTLSTLDTLANEAMRNVHDGVDAFTFLIDQDEMESASKRLAEAFSVGEHLPDIRTLPRVTKRKALAFTQKANRLISALDVKDYSTAESLVNEIRDVAKDFDTARPLAAIETAKTLSAMHLAKAKNAAVSGDGATLEKELKEATMIWPRNPALAEISSLIFSRADAQQEALIDLEQLLSQKNHRQILRIGYDTLRLLRCTPNVRTN